MQLFVKTLTLLNTDRSTAAATATAEFDKVQMNKMRYHFPIHLTEGVLYQLCMLTAHRGHQGKKTQIISLQTSQKKVIRHKYNTQFLGNMVCL